MQMQIYEPGELSAVRWRGGVGAAVRRLRFSSSLPGGFTACTWEVAPHARHLPLRAGQVCAVVDGFSTLWWGWVEDVRTVQRGRSQTVVVTALGPWQVVNQRLITALTVSDVNSSYVLRDMLAANCPDLSQDYSQLTNSAVPVTLNWSYKPLADLTKTVCDAGNAAGQPLLFAVWEPPGSAIQVAAAGTLNDDPELEQLEVYWSKGSDLIYYSSSDYVSPRYSWKWTEGATGGITHKRRIAVAASTMYVIDFWLRWTAWSGMTTAARFDWYNSAGDYLSSSYAPTLTSNGVTTTWQRVIQTITSPVNAAQCVPGIGCYVGTGGGAARYLHVDDVRMYLYAANLGAETRPRVRLWARDLNDYDYVVRSAALADGVQITRTTRDLSNYVVAQYGNGMTTTPAEDAASQLAYRRRDQLLNAGNVAQPEAEALRDAWLTLHAQPGQEAGALRLTRGSVLTRHGAVVSPARLRAGDRLRVQDGAQTVAVVLLEQVEYDAETGVATAQPERYTDASRLLARVD